jgi:hypothetical protein
LSSVVSLTQVFFVGMVGIHTLLGCPYFFHFQFTRSSPANRPNRLIRRTRLVIVLMPYTLPTIYYRLDHCRRPMTPFKRGGSMLQLRRPRQQQQHHHHRVIATIITVALAWATVAQRVPDAAVYFPMAWEDCRTGGPLPDVGNVSIGGLQLNGSSPGALCHPGGGVGLVNNGPAHDTWARGSLVFSSDTFSRLHSANITSTTVEAWLTPADNATFNQETIFAISFPFSATQDLVMISLWQASNELRITFQADLTRVDQSRTEKYTIPPATQSAVHVAIIVTNYIVSTSSSPFRFRYGIYINEQPIIFNFVRAEAAPRPFWTESSRLYLFSAPPTHHSLANAAHPWQGTIHSFAIYPWDLTAAEVQQNYQARVPNSRPLVLNATRMVQRNGEVGSHYATPEFYLVPVPVLELVAIPLPAHDADEDLRNPNYNASAPPHSIVVTSLPSKGTLYLLDGTEVITPNTTVPRRPTPLPGDNYTTPTAYLRYRPLWREVSAPAVYTSFTFVAVDGVTGLTSTPATIHIVVTPTHDIPVAHTSLMAAAVARVPVVIPLNGTASGGASVVAAFIVELPQHGLLYQVHPSNGSVAWADGPIALPVDSPSVGAALWGLAVAYVYTGPQDLALADDGTLAKDGFVFRVGDNITAVSLPANVSVEVRPAISAVAAEGFPSVVEGESTEVVLRAIDALQQYQQQNQDKEELSPPHDLCFEITALPLYGSLLVPDNAMPINASGMVVQGHLLPAGGPYAASGVVIYQSAPNFFNWPRVAWDGGALEPEHAHTEQQQQQQQQQQEEAVEGSENFAFRVVGCEDSSMVSQPVTQSLRVVNRNDSTSVTAPSSEFGVMALGSLPVDTSAASSNGIPEQQQQ